VLGTGEQRVRGDIDGDSGLIFWGMPNAASVALGGEWRGTLVAPKAHVVGDMRTGAMLTGNFFVNHFTPHQGRWLTASTPFRSGAWIPTCSPDRRTCS
jgi:choice-of-anchor A domain-containing protein